MSKDYWKRLLSDPMPKKRIIALRALGSSRHNLGLLMEHLQREKNTAVRRSLVCALQEIGIREEAANPEFVSLLHNADPEIRLCAVESLSVPLDRRSIVILPFLLSALDDLDTRVVQRIGSVIQDTPLDLICNQLGLTARSIESWISGLGDAADVQERARAAITVGGQGAGGLPMLQQLLRDPSRMVRRAAAISLMRFGRSAFSTALNSLDDTDPGVQCFAIRYLGIYPEPLSVTVHRLIRMLDAADGAVRSEAAYSVATIGPRAKAAIPWLIHRLYDSDCRVRLAATHALAYMGEEAAASIPALIAVLKDVEGNDAMIRAEAIRSMASIYDDPRVIMPSLVAMLYDDELLSSAASDALLLIATEATDGTVILSDLLSLFEDASDSHIRELVVKCLDRVQVRDENALRTLGKAVSDNSPRVRLAALECFGNHSEWAELVTPAILTALNDQNRDIREEAARLLGKLPHSSPDVEAALVHALEDPDAEVRFFAAQSLSLINPFRDEPARIFADTLLHHPNREIRRLSAVGLRRLGGGAIIALPALHAALHDEHGGVREEVKKTMIGFHYWNV